MAREPRPFDLHVGERYRFNFPGSPGGVGTFLGWTSFGWIAMNVRDSDDVVKFYNLANLNALVPESYPPEA